MTVGEIGNANSQLRWKKWDGINRKRGEGPLMVHPHTMWQITCGKNRIQRPTDPRFIKPLNLWCNPSQYSGSPQYAQINNKIVSKLAGFVEEHQYLADLYEAKSSISLIENTLVRCLRAAKKLPKLKKSFLEFPGKLKGSFVIKPKKIRGKGPRKNLKKNRKPVDLSVVPAEWLSFWFGAMPLYGSISGFGEIFSSPLDPVEFRFSSPRVVMRNSGKSGVDKIFIEGSLQVSGKLRVRNPNIGIIQKAGLDKMLSTVWEIAPWSWAVDYFANIGQMLANFDGLFQNVDFENPRTTFRVQGYDQETGYKFPSGGKVVQENKQFGQQRRSGVPLVYQFETKTYLSTKRASYLASAVAITLKGKMS